MNDISKIFTNGRSHAEKEGVALSKKSENWNDFLAILKSANIPSDFLDENERSAS
jgi:hypothetical protein